MTGDSMPVVFMDRLIRGNNNKEERKMKEIAPELGKPSYWQIIFLQSKVNGAQYSGEALPGRIWDWPKDTYFRRRLQRVKFFQPADGFRVN
jgi:hypothetical protein